ncbi:unnamed protein product [Umbelopsis vinacea]
MDECVNPRPIPNTENGSTSAPTVEDSVNERTEANGAIAALESVITSNSNNDSIEDEFQSTVHLNIKRKRELSTQESSSDEESICQCPICFENWANSGSHRIVSMKCGHLFGLSCIERWISRARKDTKPKCPQCNATITKREIRPIWAKKVTSEDASKIEQLQYELKAERLKNAEQEALLSKLHLAYEMCKNELTRKDAEIKKGRMLNNSAFDTLQFGVAPATTLINGLEFKKKLKFHNTANICRVMAFNPGSGMIVASKSTPEGIHGIHKISLVDNLNANHVVNPHSRAIRDLQCSSSGLCLTTSLDGTAKISSLSNNCVVQSYNLDAPGWCCGWDDSDENRLYCGLVDDTVMVFDVRNTRDHIYHLKDHALTKKKPIHSIVHLGGPKNSILCANLDCLYKWDLDGDIPTCSVIEMNSQADNIFEVQNVFCNPQKQTALARTWHFSKPRTSELNDYDTEFVICAGDEVNKSLCLWDDVCTQRSIDIGSNVMDVKSAVINNEIYLAALTGNEMHLYRG